MQPLSIHADAPIATGDQDKLGFHPISIQLARALIETDLSLGFVVGIEGSWGSGKSSLANLALAKLSATTSGPYVLHFSPWLIGDRNELLQQLFAELSPAVSRLVSESERCTVEKLLEAYGRASSPIASIADIANVAGLPYASQISRLIRFSGKKATAFSKPSLSSLNTQLRAQLAQLNRPLVVFIDDLDRLEPAEAVEVLRLVRAVADFPNVAYILAYDADVLSYNLESAIGVKDGKGYLEKVVQVSFKVPMPLGFDLRNWLREEIYKLLSSTIVDETLHSRAIRAINQWCNEYVSTPRHVIRILNALRLYVVPVSKEIDLADAVFLQIVRIHNPALYSWIEEYVRTISAIGDWATLNDGAPESMGKRLLDCIGGEGKEREQLVYALGEHLPGLNVWSLHEDEEDFAVFSDVSDAERQRYVQGRRLASPYHFRLYFSFSIPDGVFTDDEVVAFLDLCVGQIDEAVNSFRALSNSDRPQGGKMAAVLLDQIVEQKNSFSSSQLKKLLLVLGRSIDELARNQDASDGYAEFLRGERQQVFGLIDNVEKEQRWATLEELFNTASSFAWLSGIVNSSTVQQGHFEYTADAEEQWLLTPEEYENIRSIFLERVRSADPQELLEAPYMLQLLYTWYQAGDVEGTRAWVEEQSSTDVAFMALLSKLKSWSRSSSVGVKYTLRPETLNNFYSSTQSVEQRLKGIAEDTMLAQEVRIQAAELLANIERGKSL